MMMRNKMMMVVMMTTRMIRMMTMTAMMATIMMIVMMTMVRVMVLAKKNEWGRGHVHAHGHHPHQHRHHQQQLQQQQHRLNLRDFIDGCHCNRSLQVSPHACKATDPPFILRLTQVLTIAKSNACSQLNVPEILLRSPTSCQVNLPFRG